MPLQTFIAKAAAVVAGGGAKRVIGLRRQRMQRADSVGRRGPRRAAVNYARLGIHHRIDAGNSSTDSVGAD